MGYHDLMHSVKQRCPDAEMIASLREQVATLTRERDDARLAAQMHLKTIQSQAACLAPLAETKRSR